MARILTRRVNLRFLFLLVAVGIVYQTLRNDNGLFAVPFKRTIPDDPLFPRSPFDASGSSKYDAFYARHEPVKVSLVEGYWAGGTSFPMWNKNFTCRTGLKCITDEDGDDWRQSDIILTLAEDPGFRRSMNRTKTKLGHMGLEPYHYDIDMKGIFDVKSSVYQTQETITEWREKPGPKDNRHIWTTYSEIPWETYVAPRATDLSKKSKDRPVMFVSSNSCPRHRREFVQKLVAKGLDIWSFGSCASEHENTDRIAKLKEICGDDWGNKDWREPKNCITEHFKFIISIENHLYDDYASEKFFHPFSVSTVPIYLGPSNIDEFSPGHNSFINARDFQKGKEFDYDAIIKTIDYYNNNDKEYAKFFQWKKKRQFLPGFLEANYQSWYNMPCLLCEKSVEMDRAGVSFGRNKI